VPVITPTGALHAQHARSHTRLLRIVIADDHPVYREGIVRAVLETGRYALAGEAGDGETALRLIVQHQPDVALLDLRMPARDALGVLRQLDREGIRVPVVVLSAFGQPHIVDQVLHAGAAGYLSKDAAREEIVFALDVAALGGHIAQRPAAHAHGQPRLLPAERAILHLLNDGWGPDEIPGITGLDAEAVHRHLAAASTKLGTTSADEMLARAHARGQLN
jgi:two-component system nitrate/nitrite response regulator NarL